MMMERTAYRLSSFSGPFLMVGLLTLCLVVGCTCGLDPRLSEADTKMEANPDSALMILEKYRFAPDATEGDSAYYGLLMTHARYKTFIDETDDSLISASAEYFLKHGDREKASRALFLQGMILMNARQLGEAAVAFRRGLDVAREGKHYMWEGQCARGLCMLYGELHDGSAQVNYATQEHEAFRKSGIQDWIDYSIFEMAIALNNNCQYDQSLSLLSQLDNDGHTIKDTQTLSQISQVKAVSLFGLGRHSDCLQSYADAYTLNPSVLTVNDRNIMAICLQEVPDYIFPGEVNAHESAVELAEEAVAPFMILAREGRYKEAYENLEGYKNRQDGILSVIFRNNVSESLHHYDSLQAIENMHKVQNERLSYAIIFLILITTCLWIIWRLRKKMHKEENRRILAEADIVSLRADFLSQMDSIRKESKNPDDVEKQKAITDFETIIRQKFSETNRLCDNYYQGLYSKNGKDEVASEIGNIVESFQQKESLQKIEEYVDRVSEGLYSSFKKDYFDLTDENYLLFLYLMLGFNSRTIAVMLGQEITAVYNKKSRLKAKIKNRDSLKVASYLRFF